MTKTADPRSEIFPAALRVWRDEEAARDFLERKHPMLGDRKPYLVALESEDGALAVLGILGRLAHGSAA